MKKLFHPEKWSNFFQNSPQRIAFIYIELFGCISRPVLSLLLKIMNCIVCGFSKTASRAIQYDRFLLYCRRINITFWQRHLPTKMMWFGAVRYFSSITGNLTYFITLNIKKKIIWWIKFVFYLKYAVLFLLPKISFFFISAHLIVQKRTKKKQKNIRNGW